MAYLLLHPGTAQHREHLAFLFWPDTNEAQALSNLRNLLYKLRRLLPTSEQFLLIEGRTVQWRSDSSYCFDVAEFEEAVAGAKTLTDLEKAVDCYHGDFLPGCDDDWVLAERERLRQLMLSTLERLIEQLEANREYRRAIRQGHRLLQLEPFNEASYRKMLSLYVADHDRAGALQLYARCVAMLKDEFGATPSPETEEIYERLQHPNPSLPVNVGVSAYQPSLVGRAKEW
ncbi:MAG: hypothetical protein KDE31_27595, partial [Caldilineaceae bacterium]|nr:hypothetical protein [Caldilineaceae bacterium]